MKNKTSRFLDELLMDETIMVTSATDNTAPVKSESVVDITESILNAVNANEATSTKKPKKVKEKAEKPAKPVKEVKNSLSVDEVIKNAQSHEYEIWVKANKFSTTNVTTSKSFVVINTKMGRYSSFNSYNDLIPNNDNVLNEKYEFDSKNTYEKKVAALSKKEYVKI